MTAHDDRPIEPARLDAMVLRRERRQLGDLRRLLLERTRLQAELADVEAALAYHQVLAEGVP